MRCGKVRGGDNAYGQSDRKYPGFFDDSAYISNKKAAVQYRNNFYEEGDLT